jgi:hypothetical protein
MTATLIDFKGQFINEIKAEAESSSELTENVFFDSITEMLIESGDIDTADRCYFVKKGIRIDGYGGDPIDSDSILTVFVCDYDSNPDLVQINKSDIEVVCKRAANFISSCLSTRFVSQLDESSSEFGLADLIQQRWKIITKIRIIFLTTKLLNLRKALFEPIPINGITAQFSCWDISRLHAFTYSGKEKEAVNVVLSDFGGALSVLPAHDANAELKSYLCAIPANTLASIYDQYGTQLLEKNVRVFLQARGAVNKGIKSTLEEQPSRFFAYNNGITATADAIETSLTKHGICLEMISDFQIVNGGQTTASIFDAYRRGVALSNVYVQMKLTVVSPERSIEIVPLVSKYANSQNRVTEADFFTNHPFHLAFERLSRRIQAPPKVNSTVHSYWFYERARGQYANAKAAIGTKGERKKFEILNPKDQVITKTDLAKVLNSFQGHPHIVSKGAQASFRFFADSVKTKWESQTDKGSFVNDKFFKDSIARLIIFKALEKQISLQDWYQGGYRANIVYYTLARFIESVKSMGKLIDYSRIWALQEVPEQLLLELISLAAETHQHLISPPQGSPSNVTEYAKTEKCWELYSRAPYKPSPSIDFIYIAKAAEAKRARDAASGARLESMVDLQASLLAKGSVFWSSVLEYCSQNNLVTQLDWSILSRATLFPNRLLDSDTDYRRLHRILERARSRGFIE